MRCRDPAEPRADNRQVQNKVSRFSRAHGVRPTAQTRADHLYKLACLGLSKPALGRWCHDQARMVPKSHGGGTEREEVRDGGGRSWLAVFREGYLLLLGWRPTRGGRSQDRPCDASCAAATASRLSAHRPSLRAVGRRTGGTPGRAWPDVAAATIAARQAHVRQRRWRKALGGGLRGRGHNTSGIFPAMARRRRGPRGSNRPPWQRGRGLPRTVNVKPRQWRRPARRRRWRRRRRRRQCVEEDGGNRHARRSISGRSSCAYGGSAGGRSARLKQFGLPAQRLGMAVVSVVGVVEAERPASHQRVSATSSQPVGYIHALVLRQSHPSKLSAELPTCPFQARRPHADLAKWSQNYLADFAGTQHYGLRAIGILANETILAHGPFQ